MKILPLINFSQSHVEEPLKIHVCCFFGRVLNDIKSEEEREEIFAKWIDLLWPAFGEPRTHANPSDNKFNYFLPINVENCLSILIHSHPQQQH